MKRAVGVVCSLIFLAANLLPSEARSQQRSFQVTLKSVEDSIIKLPDEFILPASIALIIDGSISLQQGKDYSIDSTISFLTLSSPLRKIFFSTSSETAPHHQLEIKYSALPLQLHRSYSRYELTDTSHHPSVSFKTHSDTILNSSLNVAPEKELNVMKSGGITRGIQAGSTQDLTFTNSFNLTFSGDLGNELSFKGALSEESTPLQPEGNTQILRDIDRIYIELNAGKIFSATLGDYVLDLKPRQRLFYHHNEELDPIFTNFSRKVLGAKADVLAGPTEVIISGSATKGQFTTFAFQGLDAVQGPYRLEGKNGVRDMIVIAGTEHVYIDGIQLVRGELNDYIIDYGLSQITFTNKRIITSASRITVDFEYTDEKYSRSLIAASQTSNFFDDKVQFTTSYIREGDDQDAPQSLTLNDSDKILLAKAGGDPLKARKPGVAVVGRDSIGRAKGSYVKIDTLISGKPITFYRYSPFDTINAIYNVSFGFAGTNKGSYTRKGIGEFDFVGIGLGDYDTTFYLPLPQLNQLFVGQLTITPFQSLAMTGEFALSDLNPNRFAPQINIQDKAYRLYGVYLDTVGILNIGATYSERYKGENFSPIDRDRKPEELRVYGLDAPIDNYTFLLTSERERKAAIGLGISRAALNLQYGLYTRGIGAYHAERYAATITSHEDSAFMPNIFLSVSHVPASDSSAGITSTWNSYTASADKNIFIGRSLLHAGFHFISEERLSNGIATIDTSIYTSFRYNEYFPSVSVQLNQKIKFGGSVDWRSDDSARMGRVIPVSDGTTYQLSSMLTNISGFSSQIDIGYRKKVYVDSITKERNGGDVSSLLLRFVPRYQTANSILIADGIYEASEQRAARQERVFFPVQKGLGNYKYLGDLNHNGKQDPEEFELARYSDEGAYILLLLPTEALFPVTDLRSLLRIRFTPLTFLGSETSIRIEENSSDPNSSDIYLFKLSHFLHDSLTLRGLIETQQDINILDNDPGQSYRLRFLERKNTIQFNTGTEQIYFKEISVRGRFHPGYEISNESNIIYTIDNARTDSHSTDQPHSTERTSVRTEWTYEPFASHFGFGLKAEYSIASDNSFTPEIKSSLNSFSANARFSISSATRLRAEIGRDELQITNANNQTILPYSLTQGRTFGSTWLWTLSLDVQIASGIVLSASYNGRSELTNGTDRSVFHNARAEVRASF